MTAPERKNARRANRVKRRVSGTFEAGGKSFRAVAMNFSELGMFLQTKHLVKVGTPVQIRVSLTPGKETVIQGTIKSTRHDQPLSAAVGGGGVGVELQSPPPEYISFLSDLRK